MEGAEYRERQHRNAQRPGISNRGRGAGQRRVNSSAQPLPALLLSCSCRMTEQISANWPGRGPPRGPMLWPRPCTLRLLCSASLPLSSISSPSASHQAGGRWDDHRGSWPALAAAAPSGDATSSISTCQRWHTEILFTSHHTHSALTLHHIHPHCCLDRCCQSLSAALARSAWPSSPLPRSASLDPSTAALASRVAVASCVLLALRTDGSLLVMRGR